VPNSTKFRAIRSQPKTEPSPGNGAEKQATTGVPYDTKSSLPKVPGATLNGRTKQGDEMEGSQEALNSVLHKVRVQLRTSHCDLEDLLAEEDRLNIGVVNHSQLRYCLGLAGVSLTKEELEVIDRSFKNVLRPESISWRDFCTAASFSKGSGGGHPTGDISSSVMNVQSTSGSTNTLSEVKVTPKDWKEEELLLKLKGHVKEGRPSLQ
ncbi:unnamed protein product, partial [Choristocarpus tenellus]